MIVFPVVPRRAYSAPLRSTESYAKYNVFEITLVPGTYLVPSALFFFAIQQQTGESSALSGM